MMEMDDFDAPNTKPGLCPVCGLKADIWDVMKSVWCCTYCNWEGRITKQPENDNEASVQRNSEADR